MRSKVSHRAFVSPKRRRVAGAVVAAVAAAVITAPLTAPANAATLPPVPWVGPILDKSLITKAQPDECFQSLGGPSPAISSTGACPKGFSPKVNGAYAWAAVRSGDYAYFGTGSNIVCYGGQETGVPYSFASKYHACEGADGKSASVMGPELGDARPAEVYQVDSRTGKAKNITPDEPLLSRIIGLRGGASHNGVVLLFGQVPPAAAAAGATDFGLVVFAFDGRTGAYLGSKFEPTYAGLRMGVVASDGNLYLGARDASTHGGLILKWVGDRANPFQYETVGVLPGNEAANLAEHQGRLVVGTWGLHGTTVNGVRGAISGGPFKIWLGPKLRAGGLTTADKSAWSPIFSYSDYDPDPVVGRSIEWSEPVSWRGDIYIGTMQLDGAAATARTVWAAYGRPTDNATLTRDTVESMRGTALFRIKNIADPAKRKVELLYGSKKLPVYNPATKSWSDQPNKLGQTPKFGLAGFGNSYNFYTWRSWVFKDRLYIGTADFNGVAVAANPIITTTMGPTHQKVFTSVVAPLVDKVYGGGDVWRMDSPSLPAVAETLDGFGNASNHGVRTHVSFEDKGFMLVGTASSFNLRTTGKNPGGWEILKVTEGKRKAPLIVPVMPRGALVTGLIPRVGRM